MRPFGQSVSFLVVALVVLATMPLNSANAAKSTQESKGPQEQSVAIAAPQPVPLTLGEVRSIYVSPMGGELRNFVIQRLLKWPDIRLATADDADAILTGAAESKDRISGTDGNVTETTVFSGEVTLLDRKTQIPIWTTEKGKHTSAALFILGGVNAGKPQSQSNLADQIVNQLRKDWTAANAPPKQKNHH